MCWMTTKSVWKQMICVSCLWRKDLGGADSSLLFPAFSGFAFTSSRLFCLLFRLLRHHHLPSSALLFVLQKEYRVSLIPPGVTSFREYIYFPPEILTVASSLVSWSFHPASGLVSNLLSKTWLWGDGVHSVRHTRQEDGGGAETADNRVDGRVFTNAISSSEFFDNSMQMTR